MNQMHELVVRHNTLYDRVQEELAKRGKISKELAFEYQESFKKLDSLIESGRIKMRF